MSAKSHLLRVLETREEIGGAAKSVLFDVPENLRETYKWRAGQHLTLIFQLPDQGGEVRRCYTISSSPVSGTPLRITVKRVKDGLISNHINDTLVAGSEVEVLLPSGTFCLDPGDTLRRTHYFFGAGSGITPLFSMIHTMLIAEPYSVGHLVYGNRNDESIIFKKELEGLQEAYPDRFTVHHVLSSPSMWSSFKPWRKGKIDLKLIEDLFTKHPPYAQDTQYYICGPGNMNTTIKKDLQRLDVPTNRIHLENFGGNIQEAEVKGVASTAQIELNGQTYEIQIAADQSILAAALEAGMEPPFSCQSGICGACRAHLTSGTAAMKTCAALDQDEISKGSILTCQAIPTTQAIKVRYPVE